MRYCTQKILGYVSLTFVQMVAMYIIGEIIVKDNLNVANLIKPLKIFSKLLETEFLGHVPR